VPSRIMFNNKDRQACTSDCQADAQQPLARE